jgi:hypothetical protein
MAHQYKSIPVPLLLLLPLGAAAGGVELSRLFAVAQFGQLASLFNSSCVAAVQIWPAPPIWPAPLVASLFNTSRVHSVLASSVVFSRAQLCSRAALYVEFLVEFANLLY